MSNYKKLDVWIFSMETVKEIYNLTKSVSQRRKIWADIIKLIEQRYQYPVILLKVWEEIIKKILFNFFIFRRGSAYEVETLLSVAHMINILDEHTFNKINEIVGKKYSE